MTPTADSGETPYARALLIEMLASIRHSRCTPLFFGIDAPGIVAAALRKIDGSCAEPSRLRSAVDRIARAALACPPLEHEHELGDDDLQAVDEISTLSRWLDHRQRLLASVHPLAMDVLSLLVEGESLRDSAERLDLGLRLSRRIARDAREAWIEGSAACCYR